MIQRIKGFLSIGNPNHSQDVLRRKNSPEVQYFDVVTFNIS